MLSCPPCWSVASVLHCLCCFFLGYETTVVTCVISLVFLRSFFGYLSLSFPPAAAAVAAASVLHPITHKKKGKTAQYNFEFDFGKDTSADLPVDGTPASTDALVCGGPITPAPVTADTPAPVAPPPTPPPVPAETPAPIGAVATTPGPVAALAETPSPLGGGVGVTEAPVPAEVLTDAPSPAVSGNGTATEAPVAAGTGGGNATETPSPSVAGSIETPVPSTAGKGVECCDVFMFDIFFVVSLFELLSCVGFVAVLSLSCFFY